MEAILYQSGPACRIYLLADGSNCPSESFLTTAANLQPDEFAKLTKPLDHSCEHGLPKNKQKVNTLGDGLFEFKTTGGLRLIGFWDAKNGVSVQILTEIITEGQAFSRASPLRP